MEDLSVSFTPCQRCVTDGFHVGRQASRPLPRSIRFMRGDLDWHGCWNPFTKVTTQRRRRCGNVRS